MLVMKCGFMRPAPLISSVLRLLWLTSASTTCCTPIDHPDTAPMLPDLPTRTSLGLCFGESWVKHYVHLTSGKTARVSHLLWLIQPRDSKCGQNRAAFPSSSGPFSRICFFCLFPPLLIVSIPPSLLLFSHHHSFIHLFHPVLLVLPLQPPPLCLPPLPHPSHCSTSVPKTLHRASPVLRLAGWGKASPGSWKTEFPQWVARQWTHKETSQHGGRTLPAGSAVWFVGGTSPRQR